MLISKRMNCTEWKEVFQLLDTLNRKIRSVSGNYSEVNYVKEAYLFIYKCKQLYQTCNCRVKLCEECKEKINEWSKSLFI